MKLAQCMNRLGTETAFDVAGRARALEAEGRDIVHLELGEPDFDTPEHIVEAAIAALRRGETHYSPPAGILPLREAIAEEVSRTRGIAVHPDEVIVTLGAKPIIFYSLLALAQPGDEIIYPDPGFPIYESMICFVGAIPVPLPLYGTQGFRFDIEELRRLVTPRTRLLIVNSPHNPTGTLLSQQDLEALGDLALQHGFMILSDEIYSRLIYGAEHRSIASLPGLKEHTIILDGFSKTYAMTGWRLGYGVMPPPLGQHVRRLIINSTSCTPAFTQWAGVAALRGSQEPCLRMLCAFKERRDALLAGLRSIPGLQCVEPQGAFYAFPDITATGFSSQAFADRLLQEYGVAALAGTAFGRHGEGYIRLSYANSLENLHRAVERIGRAVAQWKGYR